MVIISITAFASNTSGEEDLAILANPDDVGADLGTTPINLFLFSMIVMGVALGCRFVRKNEESQTSFIVLKLVKTLRFQCIYLSGPKNVYRKFANYFFAFIGVFKFVNLRFTFLVLTV
jgi:hypothetical protein